MSKTVEEIEALKRNWIADPLWDIENTEGFEEYAAELLAFSEEKKAEWIKSHERKMKQRLLEVRAETGIDDPELAKWLWTIREIEISVNAHNQRTENDDDNDLPAAQVHATLLLAAQVQRIADVLERHIGKPE